MKTDVVSGIGEDEEKGEIGHYQISSTSTTMGSGLPWFAVWVVDTKTVEVKWVDHPDIHDSMRQ